MFVMYPFVSRERINRFFRITLYACLAAASLPSAHALDLVWTRTTGQTRPESAPILVRDFAGQEPLLVSVNQGGQVMAWRPDGADFGEGQDGTVADLPEDTWTSSPAIVTSGGAPLLVFCSGSGQVIALDAQFKIVWTYRLPGETWWARATPLVLPAADSSLVCLADKTGTVTALRADGVLAWRCALEAGMCRTLLGRMDAGGESLALVGAGATLCAVDATGAVRWRRDLPHGDADPVILTRPEALVHEGRTLIVCAVNGTLCGLEADGSIRWTRALCDEIDATINVLRRAEGPPLIVCTGLWGNVYALDFDGNRVWTHLYRAKTRARLEVADFNGDGAEEIAVGTYGNRVLLIDATGQRTDEMRLCGLVTASPLAYREQEGAAADLIVSTGAMLSHRLRAGAPQAVYGEAAGTGAVSVSALGRGTAPALLVENPANALLRVAARWESVEHGPVSAAIFSARSRFEWPLPAEVREASVRVLTSDGLVAFEGAIAFPGQLAPEPEPIAPTLRAWPTLPYADFDERAICGAASESAQAIRIDPLYVGEVDQGAVLIASTFDKPIRVRIGVAPILDANGAPFGGAVQLREVVYTGTVNGERAADALPALNAAGVTVLQPQRAAKIWITVDGRNASPGEYATTLTVTPLEGEGNALVLPLQIAVPNLAMPERFPLTLCTWDYVPNQWFSASARATLDDMNRHGVSVFPRSAMPPARIDATGVLAIDWKPLDEVIALLGGRGAILFSGGLPPISDESNAAPEALHAHRIAYLQALRDYLAAHGYGYEAYAFYPTDEPGLDFGRRIPGYMESAQLYAEADPKFRVYTNPVPTLSRKDFETIEPVTNLWAPSMRLVSGLLVHDPRSERIMASGNIVWSYECVSQVKSLSPLAYNRGNAWRATYFGLSGIGFWTHSQVQKDPWFAGETQDDEYALVYPGDGPTPSVRWEAVRDGLEDVAALDELERRIAAHEDMGTKMEIVREAKAARNSALIAAMECSDETFIESRDFLKKGDRRLWHTSTDAEEFVRHRKRIAELTLALAP